MFFVAAFICGVAGAFAAIRLGPHLGLLDRPCERSSHAKTTPKGGGIGILLAFALAANVFSIPAWFWLPIGCMSLLGLIGDRLHLSQILRLMVQLLCCGVAAAGILTHHPALDGIAVPAKGVLIVFFALFVAGTANYYNFMDGINGIAGLTGIVAFGFLSFFCRRYLPGLFPEYGALALTVAAGTAGFLPFNFPRARVFMGDVGSILLGALFGCLVLMFSKSLLDFLCLCGFLFPFYADELVTTLARLRNGENLLMPHRRHVYQILANQMKIPHWLVSASYAALQILIALIVLALRPFGAVCVAAFLVFAFVAFFLFGNFVRQRELRILYPYLQP